MSRQELTLRSREARTNAVKETGLRLYSGKFNYQIHLQEILRSPWSGGFASKSNPLLTLSAKCFVN